jgi:DNA mismatch repair protein MutS
MTTSSPPLIKYYFEEQQNVQTKFGEKTILFMMVGMFYEVYELEKKGFANVVSEKCGILLTRKNKSLDISPSNPWMCGFPCPSLSKFIKKLHVYGYSVAVYDQNQTNETEDKNDIRRILSGVYSPSSPMELLLPSSSSENEQHENTTLTPRGVFCIYREKVDHHGIPMIPRKHQECLWNGYGIYIDYDSGKVLGLMWSQSSLSAWRSETMMYLQRYHPREIYLYPGLEEEMELWKGLLFLKWIPKMEQKDWDISYQVLILEKTFGKKPNDKVLILERLHLDRCQEWTAMLVNVLNFLYLHHPLLVFRLKPPQFQEDTNHLKCNQDLYEELNIFSGNPSLFQLTDKTCTAWGSRLWRRQLMTPTSNIKILNRRWTSIQNLLNLSNLSEIRKGIQQFPSDPWMFWRRWECKKFPPTMALTMMTKMYFLLHDALTLIEEVMPIPECQEWSKEPFSVLSKNKIREAILFFENILCSSEEKKLDWKASQKIRKRNEEEWKKFQEKFKKIDYLV